MAKKTQPAKTQSSNDYILLDRSGSMANRWGEALSSVNAYVDELKKKKATGTITVATFDRHNGMQFDVIRDAVTIKAFKDITGKDAAPRGDTPLLDALVHTISLAEKANSEKTVIVVMTDGHENASTEVTKEIAKAAVERCKARNWQVLFLGADFDSFGEAVKVGVNYSQNLVMTSGNYGAGMRAVAEGRFAYASTANASMNFSEEDRLKQTTK